ncbi:MAG: bifunctional phosphoribosylaminoimidazolecarboxamide formyltransferase/inosine monophosphate cyclohydrolase [SAR116 cluster bacterium]|nr:bifunctional phosphoribosylaminoimidazolecarboxamide formyltransferase/inosine monophosphate cyclohydrolase [SAR116 cluster bacterium]RPH10842.1 MAG: bifunctional phosphoribosylaminoimidazolecarboxamide formyltransferase/IMP cyclohydrolase PurH [Alphaproteobacteria bacterium TMED54]
MSQFKIKNALISLTDKNKIEIVAKELTELGIKIISTGGTAKYLKSYSIEVDDISEITNFPEILGGRVKSLHPKIFGGILYRKNNKHDLKDINTAQINSIDLVIVNLYQFKEATKNLSSSEKIIENIDIGGPSLIRAAAKNFAFTTVIVDINDYDLLINKLKSNKEIDLNLRKSLAAKAFKITSEYDKLIFDWFNEDKKKLKLPKTLNINLNKIFEMRYGENPHQKGALYKDPNIIDESGIANYKQFQGKELSYNNLNDADAAFELVNEFKNPAVAIIKHANPCGVSQNKSLLKAWENAFNTDQTSAFGGIVALNRPLNEKIAEKMSKIFLEVIIAPKITKSAEKILSKKKNLRILLCQFPNRKINNNFMIKTISGGYLLQEKDDGSLGKYNFEVVTNKKPTKKEIIDLKFAWIVSKHTKSNAIIFVKNSTTLAIGAGQMSRIDSVIIAQDKFKRNHLNSNNKNLSLVGSVLSSDAFFPFSDTLITAAKAGVSSIIQPGGSIRDKEVIQEANKRDISMIFTSLRHFRH